MCAYDDYPGDYRADLDRPMRPPAAVPEAEDGQEGRQCEPDGRGHWVPSPDALTCTCGSRTRPDVAPVTAEDQEQGPAMPGSAEALDGYPG